MENNAQSNTRLLSEFDSPTYEQWRAVVERDLKGAPFEKKLITRTPEGIDIQPMYFKEALEGLSHLDEMPGSGLCSRAADPAGYRGQPWAVAQTMPGAHPAEVNKLLREALGLGQTAINISLNRRARGLCCDECSCGPKGGVCLATLKDWDALLEGLPLESTPFYINATGTAPVFASQFYAYVNTYGLDAKKLSGSFGYDPLGALAESGKVKGGWEKAKAQLIALAEQNVEVAPKMAAADASGLAYHEAGASATQELAFAVAAAVEYMRALVGAGMQPDAAASQIRLVLGVGPTLFMEMSKFRAARILWSRALKAFGAEQAKPRIHARTGEYAKTKTDPYVNMLRTQTEAFAAVVGGCESLEIGTFDEIIRPSDTFSRRIARNMHTMLREEHNLDRVIDPAGGSWYIETLTSEVAKQAWGIFQEVETRGGLFKALSEGYPQESVAKTAQFRTDRLNKRASVLVGLNMYANVCEKPLDQPVCDLEAICEERKAAIESFTKSDAYRVDKAQLEKAGESFGALLEAAASGATFTELADALYGDGVDKVSELNRHRLAEGYEQLRQLADAQPTRPKIFLANMGPLVQHKLRADFIRGFFECGGFDVVYPDGFADAESVAEAACASGAKVAVICSTDSTYPELVPAVTQAIKGKDSSMRVLMAGFPGDQETAYKEAGLDDYIFIKSNHYNTLKDNLAHSGVSIS